MGKICKALQDIRQKGMEEGYRSGLEDGHRAGQEDGRRAGREEERRIITSQMKKEGFSPEVIARILQLSESSV